MWDADGSLLIQTVKHIMLWISHNIILPIYFWLDNNDWFNDNCGIERGYICEKPVGGGTIPPVISTTPTQVEGYCPRGYYGIGNYHLQFTSKSWRNRFTWIWPCLDLSVNLIEHTLTSNWYWVDIELTYNWPWVDLEFALIWPRIDLEFTYS